MSNLNAPFNEKDIDSYYFGPLTFDEATHLLSGESAGVFLIRDSSRGTGYVLCLKEKNDVKNYPIASKTIGTEMKFYVREESSFPDLPSLLSFYKRNLFETTALVRPICKQKVYAVKPHLQGASHRRSELVTTSSTSASIWAASRFSAPPGLDIQNSEDTGPPVYARVTKSKTPSAYDSKALKLMVGDIIQITKRCNSGHWEGEINGKKGVFPFTCVEVLTDDEGQEIMSRK